MGRRAVVFVVCVLLAGVVAIAPETQRRVDAATPTQITAYVTSFGTGSLTPIDTTTNTAGAPIDVGDNPHPVAITPDGTTAYVGNINPGNSVTPVNLATNTA